MEGKLRVIKDKMASLDLKGELFELLLKEVAELHELSVNFHYLSRVQASMWWKEARMTWLQEGDANSKFFHVVMSSKQCSNDIQLIKVNGIQVEGVQNIREAVFNYFSSLFKVVNVERPRVEELNFQRISLAESGNLIRPFFLVEVKQAV